MAHRIVPVLLLWLCAFAVYAAGPGAVRKQVESSMLITGSIDIQPDGSVSAHRIDQAEKVPAAVVELVAKAVSGWRFEPVVIDGSAVRARTYMALRLVAKKIEGEDSYRLSIRSASFSGDDGTSVPGESIERLQMKPPHYPEAAWQAGITGDVYLLIRVDRQGKVAETGVERVDLKVVGNEQQMRAGRDVLAKAALRAARKWTFKPPTIGRAADKSFWDVRVPVSFMFEGQRVAGYGEWDTYVPGPQQPVPWLRDAAPMSDAMVAGQLYPVGAGPRLLTPLGG